MALVKDFVAGGLFWSNVCFLVNLWWLLLFLFLLLTLLLLLLLIFLFLVYFW